MVKYFIILMCSYSMIGATEHICHTKWIQKNTKKYLPPKTLEKIFIQFMDNADRLKFRTENQTSYFEYESFLDVENRLGISFKADNGNLIDIFQDGTFFIWVEGKAYLKANCDEINLDIGKLKAKSRKHPYK